MSTAAIQSKPANMLLGVVLLACNSLHAAHAFDKVTLSVVPGPELAAVPLEQHFAGLQEAPDGQADGQVEGKHLRFPWASPLRRGVLPAPVPGALPARWLSAPVAVLGADAASAKWLRHNLRALWAMRATGLVVQADSLPAWLALHAAGDGLPLAPVRGPWLAKRLAAAGVDVYPVLIQTNGEAVQIVPFLPGVPASSAGQP